MATSNFIEIVDKYLASVVGKITDKYNDKYKEEALLYREFLTEEYSADLMWSSSTFENNIVAADVVSLDSSLPLKKRDSLYTAVGQIPKLGVAYSRGEKFLTDITVMANRGAREAEVAAKVLADVARAIRGVEVRTEIMFEQGLSTGYVLINDENKPGVGIRAKLGYNENNFFKATATAWGESDAKPLDDIDQLFDKAQEDGNTIVRLFLSKKYFNYLRNSTQGKQLAATYAGQVVVSVDTLVTPSRNTMREALEDNYDVSVTIVDSSFRTEAKNGETVTVNPWEQANIVGVCANMVGRLVYGTLAEESRPVADVAYAKSGSHILVAEFGETNPLREFTTAQALCIPVIDNPESVYVLQADQTSNDSTESSESSESGNSETSNDATDTEDNG